MHAHKQLRLLNLNARSVMNKTEPLEILLLQYDPHITVITETWLHEQVNDGDIFPPSYTAFRKDRQSRGGGVAVLIQQKFDAVLLDDVPELECICIKVTLWGHSFIVCALYRPPDSTLEYLLKLKEHMSKYHGNKVLLIGDFNLPGVDWERFETFTANISNANAVFDIMLAHNLVQLVHEPTHYQGTARSILDLVFIPRDFSTHTVVIEQGLSDHYLVSVSIPLVPLSETANLSFHCVKDYTHANDACIIEHLETCLIDFVATDVCRLWDQFKRICFYCIEKFIPSKRKKVHKHTPWMTRSIIHLKRKVKRLKKKHADPKIIADALDKLAHAVHTSKEYYFNTSLANFIKNDPKKFWNYISEKKKPISQVFVNGSMVSDQAAIAQHLNEYFHSVFSTPSASPSVINADNAANVNFISYSGVVAMLLNSKTKTSCGPDNIPNIFLRRFAESVAKYLLVIFRVSLLSAELPDDWKSARIVPIFKKGDRLVLQNYRPISLTSSCCKLIEHIIAHKLNEFLEERSVLTNHQHGFRKGFSTTTQLVTIVHTFAACLDANGQIDVIFLDYSKAFDTVPHDKLIIKLRLVGIPELFISWISAYLLNRNQYVQVGEKQSGCLPVTSGVPQGSVLGPLLFLVYINDIVNVISTPVQIRLFADDCVLFRDVTCISDQCDLNTNLGNVSKWCEQWGMLLNANKCVYLPITRKKVPLDYTYNLAEAPLLKVASYKYLGLTLTSTLSWNLHINNICSAAFRKLCLLRHKLKTAPPSVKLLSYFSLIRPKLEYASIVWDPHTKINVQNLERIQRKAVRFIYSKFMSTDSPTALLTANGIELLQIRRKKSRLQFLSDIVNHRLPLDTAAYVSPLLSRPTRHHYPHSLTPIFARTDTFRYSFFPQTIDDWNKLTEAFPQRP